MAKMACCLLRGSWCTCAPAFHILRNEELVFSVITPNSSASLAPLRPSGGYTLPVFVSRELHQTTHSPRGGSLMQAPPFRSSKAGIYFLENGVKFKYIQAARQAWEIKNAGYVRQVNLY